jgi:hypothetical protein
MASLEDMSPEHQEQAVKLFSFVNSNPDVAKMVRKEAKKRNPNMQTPDLDLEDRLEAQKAEFDARLAKQDEERLAEIQTRQREEAHKRIRDAGFEPDAIEKIMVDERIGSYDTAIKYARAQRQLAPATPELRTPMTMPDTKELWADKNAWSKSAAFDAVNELKAKRLG